MPPDSQPSNPAVASTPQMFCKKCGYALIGLESQVCPECGRAFDPANRKTFSRKPPRGLAWRWGKRLAALLLLFLLAAGGGIWLLWRGWHAEQPTIARLRATGVEFTVAPIVPQRMLGSRWGYLADRVDYVSLQSRNAADIEALDLASLSQIKKLSLYECEVSNSALAHLAGLRNLQTLNLRYLTKEKPDLAFLEKLPALSEFTMWGETSGPGAAEHIGRSDHLKRLHLFAAGLNNDDLKQLQGLSSLEELRLVDQSITDTGLAHLQGLKSLKRLYVNDRLLHSPGMAKLKQALPELQVSVYGPASAK